jgi:acetyl esterase/lipase
MKFVFASLVACLVMCDPLLAAEPLTLKLWPDGPPSAMPAKSQATIEKIASYGPPRPDRITDVSDPTITIYKPEHPNGTAVVVAPGGGFMFLSWANEGTKVCEWLNSIDVTAVLLKYRTPTRDDANPFTLPVQDAQRALGLVRHHVDEWGINPDKVGLLGFSAGANLAGHASWDALRTYPQAPDLDDPRGPDFLVFIYGGAFLSKEKPNEFREGFKISANAPPAFFLVAHDDKSNPVEAALLYLEYKKQNIPADLHIFTRGGHGFGMRDNKQPVNGWPRLCAEWMQSIGMLPAQKTD